MRAKVTQHDDADNHRITQMSSSISCLPLPVIIAVLVVVVEDFVADPVHPGSLLWVHWIPTIHSLVDTSQTKHCLTPNLELHRKNAEMCPPKQPQ